MNISIFDSISLESHLVKIPKSGNYWIAYSGGADSTALLHLLANRDNNLFSNLRAVHVNHQLNKASDSWSELCKKQCESLGIELKIIKIDASTHGKESPEAYARKLRYENILGLMTKDDILFTAHHKDDQAETLLLQLFRGSGPAGLSAMPLIRRLDNIWLARPLLDFTKEQLIEYNRSHNLQWIDDESNFEDSIDRNYLRYNIMPRLKHRWEGIVKTLSRVARHQSEQLQLADEIANDDLLSIVSAEDSKILCIDKIQDLSEARQKNLLRFWIKQQGFGVPAEIVTGKIFSEVIAAKNDATPCLKWGNTELRRYRNMLYIMKHLENIDINQCITWDFDKPMDLMHGTITAEKTIGKGIAENKLVQSEITVRFRQGGEKINLPGKRKKSLKSLFQENNIAPWERERLPLVYVNEKLAGIANLWTDFEFEAKANEPGRRVRFDFF